jgi:hypothetical protein
MRLGRSTSGTTSEHEYHDDHHDDHRHDGHFSEADGSGAPVYDGRHREADARDRFGGTNFGAAFFGWLVTIAMAVLLTSIVGAVATAVGASGEVSRSEAQQEAGTVGVVAAVVLLAVMLIAYYTGGYVAGRMSRYDGGRQGFAVWIIGLAVTLVAVGLGLLLGSEYNLLDRVSVPRLPVPTDQLGLIGIITAVGVLVGTALAAVAGGKVGHRYHDKVDRAAYR